VSDHPDVRERGHLLDAACSLATEYRARSSIQQTLSDAGWMNRRLPAADCWSFRDVDGVRLE
jgi:hypothetical protein